ncbi:MAG: hypothetical protein JO019_03560 [Candidatus Kaiserbacteria bacterium]|nr:hypothetical protein [Candidatus Kaiserbacteria bacterium]
MRSKVLICALLSLLLPLGASALAFGFPHEPIWVSRATASEGEAITVYAAIYNATSKEMVGTVDFLADGTAFDTKDIELPAGGSQLVSADWSAKIGAHALSARFKSGSESDETSVVRVLVTPKILELPSGVQQSVESAKGALSSASSTFPVVTKAANAVIAQTEKLRTAGAQYFSQYLDQPQNSRASNAHATTSVVKGFGTSSPKATSKNNSLLHTGIQTAAVAAVYTFSTAWLFYLLVILALYILWRLAKRWVNGPRF